MRHLSRGRHPRPPRYPPRSANRRSEHRSLARYPRRWRHRRSCTGLHVHVSSCYALSPSPAGPTSSITRLVTCRQSRRSPGLVRIVDDRRRNRLPGSSIPTATHVVRPDLCRRPRTPTSPIGGSAARQPMVSPDVSLIMSGTNRGLGGVRRRGSRTAAGGGAAGSPGTSTFRPRCDHIHSVGVSLFSRAEGGLQPPGTRPEQVAEIW